jgi:hypothetical protein
MSELGNDKDNASADEALARINLSLHPDHMKDLMRSGLLPETIQQARIYSVRPADISRKLQGKFQKVESLLAFPYHGNNGFERYKLFPSQGDVRYFQPVGTPARLYVPPQTSITLKDKSIPLYITEGEKKTLKAAQEGLSCIGLGGLWNWSNGGDAKDLIPDFHQIELGGRKVYIVPDNDWLKPGRRGEPKNLKQAVQLLGDRLIDRGAHVHIVQLPDGLEKVGLDDYLLQHTVDELKALPTREHRKRPLEEMVGDPEEDYREILKRLFQLKQGEQDALIKILCKQRGIRVDSVRQDLKALRPVRESINVDDLLQLEAGEKVRHSAQTLHEGQLAYGGVFGGQKVLIRSDGEIIPEDKEAGFKFTQPRIRAGAIKALKDGKTVSGQDLLNRLRSLFSRHVYFRDPRVPTLLATWAIGTYVFKLFRFYGYLILNSPVKGCGKSLVLDILSTVCFDATARLVMPSAAVIFRQVDGDDCTLVIDEAENLGGADPEKQDIVSLLNAGFQRGAVCPRMEGKGTDMRIRYFNAYSPKALAAINKLAGTLEDRAFRIVMEKKTVEDRVERFNLKKVESETEALRDELYLWSLRNAEDVADLYGKADEFPGLEALGDRQKDILEPLLSIALAIDGEVEDGGPMTMFERLRSLAIDLNKGKEERDKATESIPAAVAILRDQMDGKEELFLTKDSLLEKLREDDALSFLESKSHLTKFMRNLDVYPIHKREGLGRVRGYSFTKDKVADWAKRYL